MIIIRNLIKKILIIFHTVYRPLFQISLATAIVAILVHLTLYLFFLLSIGNSYTNNKRHDKNHMVIPFIV